MNLLKKYYPLLPLLLICLQILIIKTINFKPTINPASDKNSPQQELLNLLLTADIHPLQYTINDSRHEVEFFLKNNHQQTYKVILSTQQNSLNQVTALQKLIKIATIKGKDLHLIDLSSHLPYATF